jgi:hypothetical protein
MLVVRVDEVWIFGNEYCDLQETGCGADPAARIRPTQLKGQLRETARQSTAILVTDWKQAMTAGTMKMQRNDRTEEGEFNPGEWRQLIICPITRRPCEGDLAYLCPEYGCARKGGLSPRSEENF